MSASHSQLDVTPKLLRQFAALWIVVFGLLAARQWLGHDSWRSALILAAIGLGVGLAGLTQPEAIRPLFIFLMAITRPIGWLVSQIVLSTLFYLVFTPIALFFKLIGRDVLCRRKPVRDSYWSPKQIPDDLSSYYRQS